MEKHLVFAKKRPDGQTEKGKKCIEEEHAHFPER
jgi:hypothetical protein